MAAAFTSFLSILARAAGEFEEQDATRVADFFLVKWIATTNTLS